MLRKTFSRLMKPKSVQSGPVSSEESADSSSSSEIANMLSASGRIGLVSLRKIAEGKDKERFVKLVQHPVLAGSAIQAGRISNQEGGGDAMNRTQIFEPSMTNPGALAASEALRHAIYPLVKGEYSTTSSRSFAIGRIDGNDMIMPDFAISKKHAIINRNDDAYYLKDLGSTNGTFVNGTRLDKRPVKIHDKDVLSFARYEFTFLLPASLYKMLRGD